MDPRDKEIGGQGVGTGATRGYEGVWYRKDGCRG